MVRTRGFYTLLVICVGCIGCVDGPFYAIKRVNPYFRSEWKKDRQLGPTFEDRLRELALLESQLGSMPAAEQEQWAERLAAIIQKDPSSEMRFRAVAAIAKLPGEAATKALNTASGDDTDKVRMAACKAWKVRGGPAARDMLLSMAQADENSSVRQAAIESLAAFKDGEVRAALTDMLSDRSPAVQYQVAQSLKSITGQDFGGDFQAWKEFMAGSAASDASPSSVADTTELDFPSLR